MVGHSHGRDGADKADAEATVECQDSVVAHEP